MVKKAASAKPASSADKPKSNPQQLEQRINELTDALMRERADATNVRRRAEEDRLKMAGYYKAEIIRELLPVIDSFERALKHIPQELVGSNFISGIEAIIKQFEKVLASLGVERVKTVGEVFDPRYHEAVQMEDGSGSREIISEELQAGYRLGDEVLRHAMVKVKLAL
jgi:molecular chaperone GrpE